LRREYETSQELLEEIRKRTGKVTLPTVSKVCSALEEDLIIERKREGRKTTLCLLQPDKLLDGLSKNFEAPEVRRKFVGKCACDSESFREILRDWQSSDSKQIVRTGASSVEKYATMAREPIQYYYCTDLKGLLRHLGESVKETDRFQDIEILETNDPTVYFDTRNEIEASPIQVYLELDAGDKRQRETAEQVRQRLIDTAKQSGGRE
jgi:hypothetical protein